MMAWILAVVVVIASGLVSARPDPYERGDANCNRMLDTGDIIYVLAHVSGQDVPACGSLDIDCNGEVTTDDALYLYWLVTGQATTLCFVYR